MSRWKPRHLTDAEKARVRALSASMKNPTAYNIALELGVPCARVLVFMREAGIEPPPARPAHQGVKPHVRKGKLCYPFTEAEDRRLIQLWRNFGQYKIAAEKLNATGEIKRSVSGVYSRLKRLQQMGRRVRPLVASSIGGEGRAAPGEASERAGLPTPSGRA